MAQPIVQSLWIGSRLSVMEQLSIRSFVANGHPFHLYAYRPLADVPDGATVFPASEILPESEIFCYQARGFGRGSVAAFANMFRYKLLLERGGWWSDLDSVCMKPLDFADEHLTGCERGADGGLQANVGMLKMPVGSPLMRHCWDACQHVDRSRLAYGDTGPRLMNDAVQLNLVPIRIVAPEVFYPIHHWQAWSLIQSSELPHDCYAIHLWNSKWRHDWLDPDARYDVDCIYEQLKRMYGIESPPRARRGPGWWSIARLRLRQRKARRLVGQASGLTTRREALADRIGTRGEPGSNGTLVRPLA